MAKKKHSALGVAVAAAAGAAVLASKNRKEKENVKSHIDPNYRNTERGKQEKNSKVFIIQMEIMKHLPVRKNPKA